MLLAAVAVIAAYLIGAVPTGLLVGKWFRGIDIREHGSKNIGFTNAARVLGWGLGIPVLIVDLGKAWGAVFGLRGVGQWGGTEGFAVALAGAVLIGNFFNVFLKFKGGKGVAAGAGVFLALAPGPMGITLAVFALLLATTRLMSLSSLTACVTLCIATGLMKGVGPVFWAAVVVTVVIFIKHRENIGRLLKGTERKFGKREG